MMKQAKCVMMTYEKFPDGHVNTEHEHTWWDFVKRLRNYLFWNFDENVLGHFDDEWKSIFQFNFKRLSTTFTSNFLEKKQKNVLESAYVHVFSRSQLFLIKHNFCRRSFLRSYTHYEQIFRVHFKTQALWFLCLKYFVLNNMFLLLPIKTDAKKTMNDKWLIITMAK